MEPKARMKFLNAERLVQRTIRNGTTEQLMSAMDLRDEAFRELQAVSGIMGAALAAAEAR